MKAPTARILYLENDADTRELVTMVLGSQDFQVIATGNQEEGLGLARAGSFDLYLLDNRMTAGSGIGLCEQLRTFDRHTPVLFYSGAEDQESIEHALSSGAQGYLVKPLGCDELAAEVLRLISESRGARSP
jgi:two-component system, cell cycle response regulator CtrA